MGNWGQAPVSKRESLRGISGITSSKKVANNTYEYSLEDGRRFIRYRFTNVIEFRPDGSMVLNSDGYLTQTTKNRINCFQDKVEILSYKREWYIQPYRAFTAGWTWRMGTAFYDGIIINPLNSTDDGKKKSYSYGHKRISRKYKKGRNIGRHYHKLPLETVEYFALNRRGMLIFEQMLDQHDYKFLVNKAFQFLLEKESTDA